MNDAKNNARSPKSAVLPALLAVIFCWPGNTRPAAAADLQLRAGAQDLIQRLSLYPADSNPAAASSRASSLRNLDSKDALIFRNGDFLFGALDSIDPRSGVRWKHPDAAELVELKPDNISEILFRSRPPANFVSTNACQVRLTNQDELEGNLLLCDAEKLVLQTWYAGTIEIPRKMVQFILPVPAERTPIFEGPTGLDGWTLGKVAVVVPDAGQWKYRNGAFYAARAASIARDVKLPDLAQIQFDVDWKGTLYIAIALYTDYLQPVNLAARETEPDFSGFYSLQLNSYSANLLAVKKLDPLRYLGQLAVQAFNQKTSAHVEIRVNKPKNTIALLVDGVLLKQWIDNDEFVGKGTGVRIVHQGQGSIRLSNLRVSEWDGQFDEKPSQAPDPKQDLARLRNGDQVTGHVQSIREGKITCVTAAGSTLNVPLNRVKFIGMAAHTTERARENPADVRAYFSRGASVTFRLEQWDGQGVVGNSPNFGKLTFNPSAFSRLELNPKSPAQ